MFRKIFITTYTLLFTLVLLFSCDKQQAKKKTIENVGSKKTLSSKKNPSESMQGESDPIANIKALPGGKLATWGSSYPKALNYFLDNNSLSAEITGLLFEPLVGMHSTKNKPVGILAASWEVSDDQKTFRFKIHPAAKWSDGKNITAMDVQYYYDVIMNPKNLTSLFRVGLKRFSRPKIIDEKTIEITSEEAHWKNFYEAGGMYAFPKHIWEGKDFNKQKFSFPVVSGPYQIKEVRKDRFVSLSRRSDWWGRIKKYNQHKYNFNEIKYKFTVDRNKALEAFKKGDYDVYAIYTSSIWMKKTDFDQINKGWVVKQKIINQEPKGFQGMAINLRSEKFKNKRVREALCHLLNRELMNEKLMYNQYFLLNSFYPDLYPGNQNPDIPLLKYDPEKARELLKNAGWKVDGKGQLIKAGVVFEITFVTASQDLRHLNIYVEDLKSVGIQASIQKLSWSSIRKKLDAHEFDMYWIAWGASRLRDPEAVWHSSTADQEASNNITGVKDPFIDSLIEIQKLESDMDKRNDILRLIDKRLNEIIPYVLLWQSDHNRLLYWNKFGTPEYVYDKYNREDAIITYWWLDKEKEARLKKAQEDDTILPQLPFRVRYTE
ncbi:MAG: ABC transporter substrate-binding protein [Fibrobacteria bacterium]|nr:ABC transporter substrate-binding protein [Fibrobacteria bacterium]